MAATQANPFFVSYPGSAAAPRYVQTTAQAPQVVNTSYVDEPVWLSARNPAVSTSTYALKPSPIHMAPGGNGVLAGSGLIAGGSTTTSNTTKLINQAYGMSLPGSNVVRVSNPSVLQSAPQHVVLAGGGKVAVQQPLGNYAVVDVANNQVLYDAGVRRVPQTTTVPYQPSALNGPTSVAYRSTSSTMPPQYVVDTARHTVVQQQMTAPRSKPVQVYQVPVVNSRPVVTSMYQTAIAQQPQSSVTAASLLDMKQRALQPRQLVQTVQYQPSGTGIMLPAGSTLHTPNAHTVQIPAAQHLAGTNTVLTYKPASAAGVAAASRVATQRYAYQPASSAAIPITLTNLNRNATAAQLQFVPMQSQAPDSLRSNAVYRPAAGGVLGHSAVPMTHIPVSGAGQQVLDFANAAALRLQAAGSVGSVGRPSSVLVPAGSVLADAAAGIGAAKVPGLVTSAARLPGPAVSGPLSFSGMAAKPILQAPFPGTVGKQQLKAQTAAAASPHLQAEALLQPSSDSMAPQEDFRVVLEYVGQHFARIKITIEAAVAAGLLGGLAPQEKQILCTAHAKETERINQAAASDVPTPRTPGSVADPEPAFEVPGKTTLAPSALDGVTGILSDVAMDPAALEMLLKIPIKETSSVPGRALSHPASPVTARSVDAELDNRPASAPPAGPNTPTMADAGLLMAAASMSVADSWSNSSLGAGSDVPRGAAPEQVAGVEVVQGALPADQFNAFEYGFFGDMACDGGLLEALEPDQLAAANSSSVLEKACDANVDGETLENGENGVAADQFNARFANLDLGCGFFS